MATKTIAWGDGSGQSLTVTYTALSGNQNITISSPANNTRFDRQITLTFATTNLTGTQVSKTLTVKQLAYTGDFSNDFSNDFFI